MRKQVFNPYLPLNVYIPDGEPHVFGDRVYVYGSQDAEGGRDFCVLDYEVWSAPVDDLTDWSCNGTAYHAKQDPDWSETRDYAMYAPDCVQGNDGRYYLYYALSGGHFTGPIHVAVSDHPDGPFAYHGCVQNPDGSPMTTYITFDPAVINDDGVIRLYYGWSLEIGDKPVTSVSQEQLRQVECMLFEKTEVELAALPEDVMGANTVELEDDMLTIRHFPRRIVPGQFAASGTSFEGHAFFEASSIRKIGNIYYFIYSSQHQHELCYATSLYPDRSFTYGGVLISNGDIGVNGREKEDRLMMTGNNHGSMVQIGDQWHIFYHRKTHRNTFSRQGCAEKISIREDGTIEQTEMTSCGLNNDPLATDGSYLASICCNLTNGHMPHAGQKDVEGPMPAMTHDGAEHFITGISDGVLIGYKYFSFEGSCALKISWRGSAEGRFMVSTGEMIQGEISVHPEKEWRTSSLRICCHGTEALFFRYEGSGEMEILDFTFEK